MTTARSYLRNKESLWIWRFRFFFFNRPQKRLESKGAEAGKCLVRKITKHVIWLRTKSTTALSSNVFLFNTVIYVFLLLYLCILILCLCIFTVPAGTLRLPWQRFFRAFSSVLRQMPGFNSQRRGTPRTLPNIFVLFCLLFALCRSVYCFVCKCVLYCCHRVATQLQFDKHIISHIKQRWLVLPTPFRLP